MVGKAKARKQAAGPQSRRGYLVTETIARCGRRRRRWRGQDATRWRRDRVAAPAMTGLTLDRGRQGGHVAGRARALAAACRRRG